MYTLYLNGEFYGYGSMPEVNSMITCHLAEVCLLGKNEASFTVAKGRLFNNAFV